jgi:hypothetical protein
LSQLAELVGGKLISLKGEANSLAASQLKLEKSLKKNGQKAAFFASGMMRFHKKPCGI